MGLIDALSPAQTKIVRPVFSVDKKKGALMTESIADHRLTSAGHVLLSVVFYGLLVLYLVFTIIAFYRQEPEVVESIVPTSTIGEALTLRLQVGCSASCGTISIYTNYTSLPPGQNHCHGNGTIHRNVLTNESITMELCHVPNPVYSPTIAGPLRINGLVISMSNISEDEYGTLDIYDDASGYHKFLTLAPMMVKSFNMGLHMTKQDGAVTLLQPFSKNYQMEGVRLDNVSDVVLQLAPFTNLRQVTTTRSIIKFLGDFGSTFEVVRLLFVILTPLWILLFARKDGNTRKKSQEPFVT